MKTKLISYKTTKNEGLNTEKYILLVLSVLGFFIGRISIFHMLNPVAIAFLGAMLLRGKVFNLALIFTLLGFLSKVNSFYIIKYLICLAIMFIINFIISNKKIKVNTLLTACLSAMSILIAGIIIAIMNEFSLYYVVIAILEAILTFSIYFVLNKGIIYIFSNKKSVLTNEEIISLGIFVGAILCGSADVYIGNVSFTYFFLMSLLIFITYIYGSSIGGTISILSTFLLIITKAISMEIALVLTMASILCGFFREKNKILFLAIFNISIILLCLLIDISLIDELLIFSTIGSSLLFLTIPCKLKASLSFSTTKMEATATYTEKLQILTSDKLNKYANSFEKLSKTFHNLSEKKTNLEQQDITNLIDEVASKVCSNCELKIFCWEKNFYSTYQNIFSILNIYENTGQVEKNAISKEFIENCINIHQFIEVLNKTFEIYKLNLLWKNKVIESRELVGKQLTGVADVISKLSENLCENINFKENLEARIKYILKENDIYTKSVIITENEKGKIDVLLKVEPCYVPNRCNKTIVPLVNEVLGKKMIRNCFECVITKEKGESICTILLVEEQAFRVNTYVLSSAKEGSSECGDSHSFLPLSTGNYLLALSDGMGSGKKAKAESKATVELLEDFMTAGFSKDLAINMINSVLFLKSSKESFATLDMCNIDLYTGVCEFVKIGAVSTFILQNGKVEIIKAESLPVGILNSVEPEIRKKKLSSNDIIVMVTDGVVDSTNLIISKENWIVDILEKVKSKNPEDIAKAIFEKTKENYKDNIKDDITVMVARIWDNNY